MEKGEKTTDAGCTYSHLFVLQPLMATFRRQMIKANK